MTGVQTCALPICPHYGYARQDRKASGREPITASLVANLFKVAGASRLVAIDLHSGQIQGFFDGPVDPLTAMPVLVEGSRPEERRVGKEGRSRRAPYHQTKNHKSMGSNERCMLVSCYGHVSLGEQYIARERRY